MIVWEVKCWLWEEVKLCPPVTAVFGSAQSVSVFVFASALAHHHCDLQRQGTNLLAIGAIYKENCHLATLFQPMGCFPFTSLMPK